MPLSHFKFNNRFVQQLPVDNEQQNFCRQVEGAFSSFVTPAKTANPTLVALNSEFARQLGIPQATYESNEFAAVFTGNQILSGMQPFSMCYGGHQFGHWAGQLGDGRAINLGQIDIADIGSLTLQLKGAGQTPYSRNADGLAVLRSSVREFLCSEAMLHLGISTTRALSLCLTGDQVTRDMFYDGNPKQELGAVVCRVSQSFVRFGSFQLPASRGDIQLLKQLVDYTITNDFSHLGAPDKSTYITWFKEVSERTCHLMVNWMRVGFVHGVMNTDNMSIIGETIDYGPYGWIDNFDLNWTPNTTDAQGKRYCFGAQPEIAQWNLFQLANAIYPLIEDAEPLNEILADYAKLYEQLWLEMMQSKLGFEQLIQEDKATFIQLENLMSEGNIDMTIFYRLLASYDEKSVDCKEFFSTCFYEFKDVPDELWQQFEKWLSLYLLRVSQNSMSDKQRKQLMNSVNPKFVLRNYLAQQAIEKAEQGDYSMIEELQLVLKTPYAEQSEFEHFANKRPEWAKTKAGCSMLSCSS